MFLHRAIAKVLKVARTKSTYLANRGMTPYFTSILMSEVKSSHIYVLLFDKTLKKLIRNMKWT